MEATKTEEINNLKNFVAHHEITNIRNLSLAKKEGSFVFVGSIHAVVDGIDVWYHGKSSNADPNYRMKVKVKDGEHEFLVSLFDEDVEKLAIVTCPILAAMGDGCSLYPHELEIIFGEPILFKGEKKMVNGEEETGSFNVTSICCDETQIDLFFETYLPKFLNKGPSSTISLLPDLDEGDDLIKVDPTAEDPKLVEVPVLVVQEPVIAVENKKLKREISEVIDDVEVIKMKKQKINVYFAGEDEV